MRAALVIRRIGPYHAARLRALAAALPDGVLALEVTASDPTYDWDPVTDIGDAARHTLFPRPAEASVGRVWRAVAAALAGWRPDLVAVPGWSDPAALAALAWCRRRRVPAIVMSDSTRHDAPRRAGREACKRAVLRMADAAFTAGAPQRDYLRGLGVPPGRIFLGYDAVDNAHFADGADLARSSAGATRAALGLPERYLLAANRFVAAKNLPRLLEAQARTVARLSPAALPLVLVGSGPGEAALRRRAAAPDLEGNVIFRPFARYPELPALYGLADGMVLASTSEPWGLVINEAMAAGLPVLASTRCGAAEDLVTEGETGFRRDPFDTGALADGLARLGALDPAARRAMGTAARRRVADWGIDRHVAGFLAAAAAARRHRGGDAAPRVTDPLLLRLLAAATARDAPA